MLITTLLKYKRTQCNIFIFCITVILAIIIIFTYIIYFDNGTQNGWRIAIWVMRGKLSGVYTGGNLAKGVHLRNVQYHNTFLNLKINNIDSSWKLSLIHRNFNVNYLKIGTIDIKNKITTRSIALPTSLSLPFKFELHDIFFQKIRLHKNTSILELNNLKFHGSSNGTHHILILDQLFTKFCHINASFNLDGKRPFIMNGDIQLLSTYLQKTTQEKFLLTAKFIGPLHALNINLIAKGNRLNGHANILIMPFAQLIFRKVQINLQHFNPNIFNNYAPQADLYLRANLTSKLITTASSKHKLHLTGVINIVNTMAGTINSKRLPIISAQIQANLGIIQQNFSNIHITLLHNAHINGTGYYRSSDRNGILNFQLFRLNLHALHNQFKTTKLNGKLSIKFIKNIKNIKLQLTDRIYYIALDGNISREKMIFHKIHLKTIDAFLKLSGTIWTTTKIKYAFIGQLKNFDLGIWLKTNIFLNNFILNHSNFKNQIISSDINIDFKINGFFTSIIQLKLDFDIKNSIYNTFPIRGQGTFKLHGQKITFSKINLWIAHNQFQLKGTFGNVSDTLDLYINAPQLNQLGYGLAGQFKLDSHFFGTLQHPGLELKCNAAHLSFGKHYINKFNCQVNIKNYIAGDVASINNKLMLNLNSTGYHGPKAIFHKLKLVLLGTNGSHYLTFQVNGKIRQYILGLKLIVQGKLMLINNNYFWDSNIVTMKNYGSPYILLKSPLHLFISNDIFCAEIIKLQIDNMIFNVNNFNYQHGYFSSAGQARTINMNRLLKLTNIMPNYLSLLQGDLILNADWNIKLGKNAYGFMHIYHDHGDINININNTQFAFNLLKLQLQINLREKKIKIHAKLIGNNIGNLNLQGSIIFQENIDILKFSPNSLIKIHTLFYLQDIHVINPLLGAQYRLNGGLQIEGMLTGTITHPKISVHIKGNNIIITSLDKGIQLKNGTIYILIKNNLINLCTIKFHGSTGTLDIHGKGKFDKNNNLNLDITMVANQLQLFAHPNRQLTLSGQVQIYSTKQQLRINSKLVINKAWFNLLKRKKPKLGNDIIITNNTPRITTTNNLINKTRIFATSKLSRRSLLVIWQINLGQNFRLNTDSANLHLQGKLILHNKPYQSLQTAGSIHITEGTYRAFGSKLNIVHGNMNFYGPINNPTLDILAIRRNQNIEAGFEVTGKARQPCVRLISNSNISDSEKLSWIMFGHGSEQSGINQQTVTNETLALISNYGGKKIAKDIGLDQLFVSSGESNLDDDHVVNLAKAISKKITVSYEQSLNKATSIAKASLALSNYWSIVIQTGAIKGIKILFNNRFN